MSGRPAPAGVWRAARTEAVAGSLGRAGGIGKHLQNLLRCGHPPRRRDRAYGPVSAGCVETAATLLCDPMTIGRWRW
ncbi:hypothetical protein GCM10027569_84270 [Flindersiella endophytica]